VNRESSNVCAHITRNPDGAVAGARHGGAGARRKPRAWFQAEPGEQLHITGPASSAGYQTLFLYRRNGHQFSPAENYAWMGGRWPDSRYAVIGLSFDMQG